MIKFSKLLNDCLTGRDNTSYDIGRVMFVLCLIFTFLFQFMEMLRGHDFKPIEFGGAIAALFTGFGLGQYAKLKTEPENNDTK